MELLKKSILNILEDNKAEDLSMIDVKNKSSVTDTMIIVSGRSTRHVKAIADNLNLLSEDRKLLNIFSNNALKFARNNTWDNYANKLDDLILEFKENKLQNF